MRLKIILLNVSTTQYMVSILIMKLINNKTLSLLDSSNFGKVF